MRHHKHHRTISLLQLHANAIITPSPSEARVSEWHQLGHMQVCTSLQTDNHASNLPLSFFTGWMPFLPPNQQRQSTEGIHNFLNLHKKL